MPKDWKKGLKLHRIELALPLLIIQGRKGLLACGYLNVETFNKTNEAAGIITGVMSHQEMLGASIQKVSEAGRKLGLRAGMSGRDALEWIR